MQTDALSFTQPGGTAQTAYRMVSFPTQLDDPRFSNLFEPLAPYDSTEWRLFSVSEDGFTSPNGGYREREDLRARLETGRGIWLISRSETTLGPVRDTSVRTDQAYEIPLHEGWNLIGNPFAFDVPISQLRAANTDATLEEVFGYDGTFVPKTNNDARLEPYGGYLVRLSGGKAGALRIDPTRTETGTALQKRTTRMTWHVDVSAQVGRARDALATFGVAPGAGDGIDPVDGREPPPVGEYVSLAFRPPVQGGRLWRDVRGANGHLQTWTATVRTDVSGRVTLRATGLRSVPAGTAVWLVDPALDLKRNLRETPQYRFPVSGKETTRRLRILVGSPAAVQEALGRDGSRPQRVRLLPTVPHPVRSHATLRYEVPEPTRVTLALYDLLGRRVATLVDGRTVEAGIHAYTWTRGARGRAVSSGTYLLRLRAGDVTRTGRFVVVR
ncbi:MAG: T9SS type A sorting domain-containing protein [Salinibacter sp.]